MTLTDSDIDRLEGRELDARIAVHLFGFLWWRYKRDELCSGKRDGLHCLASADAERINGLPKDRFERAEQWPHDVQRLRGWEWVVSFPGNADSRRNLPCYSTDLGACADVLAWLDGNAPTPQQAKQKQWVQNQFRQKQFLTVYHHIGSLWQFCWTCPVNGTYLETHTASLPLALCRFALRTWLLLKSTEAKT